MPYDYLFGKHCRKSMGIDIKKSIIVMDEGHCARKQIVSPQLEPGTNLDR